MKRTPTWMATLTAALLGACGGEAYVETEILTGAEETGVLSAELSSSVAVGSTLRSTTAVNLRSGPSTSHKTLLVVPRAALVVTVDLTTPSNGFYKVKYNGTVGYSHGAYYELVSSPASASTAPLTRDQAISRAKSGVGFSYWWGHARFRPEGPASSTRGSCAGACPNCSHSGSYGGDCSGYLAKAWAVGANNSDLTVDSHPYSTYNFAHQETHWSKVSRSSLIRADALVYNANGAGHIVLFESGDGWGSMWTYECRGCAYGCVRNLRTLGSEFKGIRRHGF